MTGNGQGSPCLDLRRVPDTLADATVGTDLVVIEGMGRAIHTNYKYASLTTQTCCSRGSPHCCLHLRTSDLQPKACQHRLALHRDRRDAWW